MSGKLSWGFLRRHRMFHAVVADTPLGYRVDLFVGRKRWARDTDAVVDVAMRRAAAEANRKLTAIGKKIQAEAGARLRKQGIRPPKYTGKSPPRHR